MVRLPCGSRSTPSTLNPCSLNATARLSVVVVFATPPFWFAKTITRSNDGSSAAGCTRTFGRGSSRMTRIWTRSSSAARVFLHDRIPAPDAGSRRTLAVVVVEIVHARDHAEAAKVDLVRARVVADVPGIARAVGEVRQPGLTRTNPVRGPR